MSFIVIRCAWVPANERIGVNTILIGAKIPSPLRPNIRISPKMGSSAEGNVRPSSPDLNWPTMYSSRD